MNTWQPICIGVLVIAVGMFFIHMMNESGREKRARECVTLAAIGVKAGDSITIYGDMPTWKIACLMGDGDN